MPRLIGLGRALEMALLADEVSDPEAERIGLVNRCISMVEFEETTRALAKWLATGPTRTYGLIKELMYKSLDMDLQASLHLEGQLQKAAYAIADHRESVDAFLHKRAAKFTGTLKISKQTIFRQQNLPGKRFCQRSYAILALAHNALAEQQVFRTCPCEWLNASAVLM